MLKNITMDSRLAYILVVVVALLFGSSFVIGRIALDVGFSRAQVLLLRGVIFLFLITMFIAISAIRAKSFKVFEKRDVLFGLIVGVVNFFAYFFQIWGLQLSPTNNAFLISTNIILVPIFAFIIFKNIPSWKLFISLPVAIIGSLLITGLLTGVSLKIGDIFSLISAVFFALNIVFVSAFLKRGASFKTLLFFIALIQTIGAFVMWSLMDGGFKPLSIDVHFMLGILIIFHLGAIVSFGAIGLQVYAQKYVSATSASMIISLESVFAAVITIIVWPKEFSYSLIGGGLLIMVAVLFLLFDFKKFKEKRENKLKKIKDNNI
ncbi:MAG: DMT family transporter [Firmicutes bacterium]|nr:DMT family transporter [Bacillota bacterium]